MNASMRKTTLAAAFRRFEGRKELQQEGDQVEKVMVDITL